MATKQSKHYITKNGRVIYLSNKELLPEVVKSLEQDKMTNLLAEMLLTLCKNYARSGKYIGYSYNEDMQGYAMMMLMRTWRGFNPDRGSNPFAFYTQCIKNSFIQYLNVERDQRKLRDKLLISQGLNPSFNYADGRNQPGVEDESDYDAYVNDARVLATENLLSTQPIERDEKGHQITVTLDEDDDLEVVEEDLKHLDGIDRSEEQSISID